MKRLRILVLLLAGSAQLTSAQQECEAPALAGAGGGNILTPQLEMDLGELLGAQVPLHLTVIEEPSLSGYVQSVGDRLVRQLPPTGIRFQFFILDAGFANAFSLPGGRVYISRKLLSLLHSEDELAGILAHEIGHIVTHQGAVAFSREVQAVLGVTAVKDRAELEKDYHQLLDNYGRNPGAMRNRESERQQLVADQVAVYTLGRANYAPESLADFWDRFAETKGNTGNWFSDVFGGTRPESRRLREMIKTAAKLSPACVEKTGSGTTQQFQKWQAAVLAYVAGSRQQALHDVLATRALNPWLRGDIAHLRFSRDGKYVLAQDAANIFVLTREPFAARFRISAPEAYPAQFTPDSQEVVFYNAGLRVETWSISEQRSREVHEMFIRRDCMQTALSPDGKVLACVQLAPQTALPLELNLFDVASGSVFFTRKNIPETFGDVNALFWLIRVLFNHGDLVNMRFSPDGRYFVAGKFSTALAVDLQSKTQVTLPPSVRRLTGIRFGFLGPDKLVGVDGSKGEKSGVVAFPGGEAISDVPLGLPRSVEGVTHGNAVAIRPITGYPVGILDVGARKIVMANKKSAIDLYDSLFVSERSSGQLGLYDQGAATPVATADLPPGPLGTLRAAAFSPDMKYLALSQSDHGAVWELTTGQRLILVRGFRGAWFGEAGDLWADFPPDENAVRKPTAGNPAVAGEEEREGHSLVRVEAQSRNLEVKRMLNPDAEVHQFGPYVAQMRATKGSNFGKDVDLEMSDAISGALLWSKHFSAERPSISADPRAGTLVLVWTLDQAAAKAEIKDDAELRKRVEAAKMEDGYVIELLDLRTGKVRAKFPLDAGKGSFHLRTIMAAGDTVAMTDNHDRVLAYSASGESRGKLIGVLQALSPDGKLLAVEGAPGVETIYDTQNMKKVDEFTFPANPAFTWFGEGGKLGVVTRNQAFYLLQMRAASAAMQPQ